MQRPMCACFALTKIDVKSKLSRSANFCYDGTPHRHLFYSEKIQVTQLEIIAVAFCYLLMSDIWILVE